MHYLLHALLKIQIIHHVYDLFRVRMYECNVKSGDSGAKHAEYKFYLVWNT